MRFSELVRTVATILKDFDSERPLDQGKYKPGIGPFRETKLVSEIANRLTQRGVFGQDVIARVQQKPDMSVHLQDTLFANEDWAIEVKIVRPYGDNGKKAENWSQNLLHPYAGNESLMGDALKIQGLSDFQHKGLLAICYQHDPPQMDFEPLLHSFELISRSILGIELGKRIEEQRHGLVHPVHQVVRCIGWQLD